MVETCWPDLVGTHSAGGLNGRREHVSFSDELRQQNADLWERMVTHPFVQELGEGTLSVDTFRRYFLQDYLFIRDLSTVTALAIAKAPDFPSARRLAGFLNALLTGEEDLFQRAFRALGVSAAEASATEPLPSHRAYSDYLVRLAYEGSYHEIVAALCVSEWTYADWASRLVARGVCPQQAAYREWIDIHATREFLDFVAWLRGVVDAAPLELRPRLRQVFTDLLRYECLFWDMAYRGEQWPK